jgi:hypothetical protein
MNADSKPDHSEPIRNVPDFLRRFMPKEYAKRKAEGRCMHCGAKKPKPLYERKVHFRAGPDVFPPPVHVIPSHTAAPVITPEVARVLDQLETDEEEAGA